MKWVTDMNTLLGHLKRPFIRKGSSIDRLTNRRGILVENLFSAIFEIKVMRTVKVLLWLFIWGCEARDPHCSPYFGLNVPGLVGKIEKLESFKLENSFQVLDLSNYPFPMHLRPYFVRVENSDGTFLSGRHWTTLWRRETVLK